MKKIFKVVEVIFSLNEITEEVKYFNNVENAKFDFDKRVDLYRGIFCREMLSQNLCTFYNDTKCFVIISITEIS